MDAEQTRGLRVHVALLGCNHIAFSGMRVTATLYAAIVASSTIAGLLMASFALMSAFTAVAMGRWVDRGGPRRPMMVSSFVVAGGGLAVGLAGWFGDALLVMFIACPLIGIFNSAFQIATQQTVARYGEPGERASNFARQSLGLSIATFGGPMLAGVCIDHAGGHANTFLILGAIAGVPLAVFLTTRVHFPLHVSMKKPGEAPGGWGLLREKQLLHVYLAATSNNAVWSISSFMIPLYGVEIGLSATAIGTLMGALALGAVAIRLCLPTLARHVHPWPIVLAAQFLLGLSFTVMPFATSFAALVPVVVFVGFGVGVGGPMSTALLYEVSPPGKTAEVAGLRMTGANIAQTAIPAGLGALGAALGVSGIFWGVAALLFSECWWNRENRHARKT